MIEWIQTGGAYVCTRDWTPFQERRVKRICTLSCNGRTDKLCVERDTGDDTRGPVAAVPSRNLSILLY